MAQKRTSKRSQTQQRPDGSYLRHAAWILIAACWLFFLVSLVGYDVADWPSSAVSTHNDPIQNPTGIVGATLAHWALSVAGAGTWILLGGGLAALIALVRGHQLTHPIIRIFGTILCAVAVGTLDVVWFGGLSGTASAPGGLIPDYLAQQLLERFNVIGVSLWMLTALAIGLVVSVDELLFRLPALINLRERAGQFFLVLDPRQLGPKLRALMPTRRFLQTAGGPRLDDGDYEEEEEEEEYDYEDEYEDGEEEEEEEEDEDEDEEEEDEEEEDEYEYEYEEDPETVAAHEDDEYEFENEDETTSAKAALSKQELQAKIAKLPVRIASGKGEVAREEDIPREENFEGYQFPGLDMLDAPEANYSDQMETHVREQAGILEETLHTYQIDAEVTGIESGPVVTLYAIQLAPGTRVARLSSIQSDLARSLQAPNIRIIPNMAGKTTVGIEVPNPRKEKVRLKELMSSGQAAGMTLPMFLGKDNAGEPLVADLSKMPHMLIAGTTGSGKSVCMNSIIMSWLYTKRPDELKLVLVDPKMVEMSQFSDIPHLMCPVVTEMTKAAAILEWAVNKMEERYELLNRVGVRDLRSYNELDEEERYERAEVETDLEKAKLPNKIPLMVFVIDELADLMMTAKEVEHSIVRIAQKARAVGIHLILATQRPQANVVTGLIKSNMPCRVSFKVASGMDSRIVLDQKGAELLLGQGDMMFISPSTSEIRRCQGTLVTDQETRKVARFLKNVAKPSFERSLIAIKSNGTAASGPIEDDGAGLNQRDPLFDQAVEVMIESGRGSVSLLQRRLAIGYSRASRLVDQMGLAGILGEHKGSVAREVMLTLEDWHRMRAMEAGDLEEGYAADEVDEEDSADDQAVPEEMPGEHLA
jgi:S-DNA-T family DNA segregation ATPase FtsK/SpoIIIE